ncbi:MAG: nuclear transport factor 2 family protein [Gammaproteobacteria bacterium]
MNARLYAELFERLTPDRIENFDEVYAADARFRDPFNDVRGVAAIQRVFRHLFEQCDDPRFEVREIVEQAELAYMHWVFRFRRGTRAHQVDGVSRVQFGSDEMVVSHLDFWDSALLYDTLPLVGRLTRWLRRRIGSN